jgi:integrase
MKELLDALPEGTVRTAYAIAAYAGLRRGELRGLQWRDIDLAKGTITVRRAWDDEVGPINPKSRKGERSTPVLGLLRDHLDEHKMRVPNGPDDPVLPAVRGGPFVPSVVRRAAEDAWKAANEERAKKELPLLNPIGLHECRHTMVSVFAAAGIPLERIGDYVGHSSTYMVDHYRHLLEGQREQDRRHMDDWLARADTQARLDAVGRGRGK